MQSEHDSRIRESDRLLVVTDQPFWRRENGSHQRSWALFHFLQNQGWNLTIFYLVPRTRADVSTALHLGLRIIDFKAPRSTLSRIAAWARNLLGMKAENSALNAPDVAAPLTLVSYRWPAATKQFHQVIRDIEPSLLLFNYIVWSNLLEDFPRVGRKFDAMVDTHDVLHRRNEEFSDREAAHWLEISRDEETEALRHFDLILAIQDQEALTFREMLPEANVITVGHRHDSEPIGERHDTSGTSDLKTVRIGLISSNNAANRDGVEWFLKHCWNKELSTCDAQLVIAGSICDELRGCQSHDMARVRLLGKVQPLRDFYDQVDFVINPTRFGSGLKIKTVEAIQFGKPLVAHPHSVNGLSESARESILVTDEPSEFSNHCRQLICNHEFRNDMSRAIRKSNANLSPDESPYAQLGRWLEQRNSGSN